MKLKFKGKGKTPPLPERKKVIATPPTIFVYAAAAAPAAMI